MTYCDLRERDGRCAETNTMHDIVVHVITARVPEGHNRNMRHASVMSDSVGLATLPQPCTPSTLAGTSRIQRHETACY